MTHSGSADARASVIHEPFRIRVHGEDVTLTDDEAGEILRSLHQQSIARTEVEEAAARAAGQVWFAVSHSYGIKDEEEHFSLRDAAAALQYGEEHGTLSADGIRCPDGTFYTRKDLTDGYTWTTLPGLNETSEDHE